MADKRIDESWKDSVEKERSGGPAAAQPKQTEDPLPPPEADFTFFLSTLGMQAMTALGDVPDPATGLKTPDLATARYLIDTLSLLTEKTKGNLSPDEENLLGGLLYELQMKFVEKTQAPRP